MKKGRMYLELAKYYDPIYSWKDYGKESKKICSIIKRYKKSSGNQLLDVACGTGNHIEYLKGHFKIIGIDLNKEMLKIAKKKFSKIKFVKADMVSFDLKKRFDIIICLFGSVGYMKTYNNLRKAINNFSKHLKPGGILLIEDFVSKKDYKTGIPRANFVDKPGVKLVRMNVSKRKGDIAIVDFHFLIATKKGVEYLRDYHELGFFDINKFLRIMKENDFEAKYIKSGLMKGRGLYIGIKANN